MRKAGATPKLTTSTRLSSSAPNRVPVLDSRATRPSSASRIPANTIYHAARGEHHRPDAEEQVEQREQARHDDDDAPHVGPGEASHPHGVPPLTARTRRAAWRPRARAHPQRRAPPPERHSEETHPPATRTGSSRDALPGAPALPVSRP